MAFAKKQISVSFSYASASVGTLSLTGLRVSLIAAVVGDNLAQLEMAIYGLSLSHMNALTLIGTELGTTGSNTVTVTAGEEGGTLATVFTGTVRRAVADAKAMPIVAFRVSATAAKIYDIMPAQPTSVQGSADVAQIAQQLAQQMGLQLENNGVSVKLSNPYLHGAVLTQVRHLAQHAGLSWTVDPAGGTLAIWPRNMGRQGGSTLISPATGMVGYPSYTSSGIAVQTYYNPSLKIGAPVNVQSDFTPACGLWKPYQIEHELESQVPRGKWFTYFEANRIGGQVIADQ